MEDWRMNKHIIASTCGNERRNVGFHIKRRRRNKIIETNMQQILDKANEIFLDDCERRKVGLHIEGRRRKPIIQPNMRQILVKANHLFGFDSPREEARININQATKNRRSRIDVPDSIQILDIAHCMTEVGPDKDQTEKELHQEQLISLQAKKVYAESEKNASIEKQEVTVVSKPMIMNKTLRFQPNMQQILDKANDLFWHDCDRKRICLHIEGRRRKPIIQPNMQQILDKANHLFGLDSPREEARININQATKNRRRSFAELDSKQNLDTAHSKAVVEVLQEALIPLQVTKQHYRISRRLLKNEIKELRIVWRGIKDSQELDKLIASKGYDNVYASDFLTLQSPEKDSFGAWPSKSIHKAWLSENVVEYYLKHCLAEYCPAEKVKYVILPTQFFRDIVQKNKADVLNHYSVTYQAMVDKIGFENLDIMLIPIHDKKKHWSVLALFIRGQQIKYFDSCTRTNKKHIRDVISYFNIIYPRMRLTQWQVHKCPWRRMKQTNCKHSFFLDHYLY